MHQYRAESNSEYGPHLRLYIGNKRTQIIILPANLEPDKTPVSGAELDKLRALIREDDEKPF